MSVCVVIVFIAKVQTYKKKQYDAGLDILWLKH